MTIMKLGAVGEFVGAIAVVVTLGPIIAKLTGVGYPEDLSSLDTLSETERGRFDSGRSRSKPTGTTCTTVSARFSRRDRTHHGRRLVRQPPQEPCRTGQRFDRRLTPRFRGSGKREHRVEDPSNCFHYCFSHD